MEDSYHTIAAATEGFYKEKGSKFISYVFPLNSEEDLDSLLKLVKKEHPKARHHCYAYQIGLDGNRFRTNDDGEPSGTAGRPILGQIKSHNVTNVLIVVVRYFGGTLLGATGLIRSYKLSANDGLQKAHKVEKVLEDTVRISFDYSIMSRVMQALKKYKLGVENQDFGINPWLECRIRKSLTRETILLLKAYIAKVHLEMVNLKDDIEACKIEIL